MKYRPDILIIRDILNAIDEDGTMISTIVYRANIPHDRLKNRLKQMIDSGLVYEVNEGDRKKYYLTKKGWEARIKINEMVVFLQELGLIDYRGSR